MGTNPFQTRLEVFQTAQAYLIDRYKESQTNGDRSISYPTTEKILKYANQINTFISDRGEGNK